MLENKSCFLEITKVVDCADKEERLVYLMATDESLDDDKDIMDYATSKPYFEQWSAKIFKATSGKSYGNVRLQHQARITPIGKVCEPLAFSDASKRIDLVIKVTDDNAWELVKEGVLTGGSIQGKLVGKRWYDIEKGGTRYTVNPYEFSLVDMPCNSNSSFQIVKTDGTIINKKFNTKNEKDETMNIFETLKPLLSDEVQKVFNGTDKEKRDKIYGALKESIKVSYNLASKGNLWFYIDEVYADKIIISGNFGDETNDENKQYSVNYSITDDGVVSFLSELLQVKEAYVAVKTEVEGAEGITVLKKLENEANVSEVEGNKTVQEPEVLKTVVENKDVEKTNTTNVEPVTIEKLLASEAFNQVISGIVTKAVEEVQKNSKEISTEITSEVGTEVKTESAGTNAINVALEKAASDISGKETSSINNEVTENTNKELEVSKTPGKDIEKAFVSKLQESHHAIASAGGACTCSECVALYNSDKIVEKSVASGTIDNKEVVDKFETIEKAVSDLSSQYGTLIKKLEATPDDSNVPAAYSTEIVKNKKSTKLSSKEQGVVDISEAFKQVMQNPTESKYPM